MDYDNSKEKPCQGCLDWKRYAEKLKKENEELRRELKSKEMEDSGTMDW